MIRIAAPLTERQAARLEADGLLADDRDGLRRAWAELERRWDATDRRAAALGADALDVRVDGEWSYLETLRHLVFVTDAWIGAVVLERPDAHDPLGLPPHFVTNGAELGLDLDARPTFDEVLAGRRRARDAMGEVLDGLTADELDRRCTPLDGRFTVRGALQNVVFEEWAHLVYATRDLDALG